MKLEYYQGDLFDLESEVTVFAHCIASDFGMYGGIARQFVGKYNMKNRLKEMCKHVSITQQTTTKIIHGKSFVVPTGIITRPTLLGKALKVGNTYNLITKPITGYPPENNDLFKKSLEDLKRQMIANKEHYLAIPKLGCGIDRMDWDDVSWIIQRIFQDTEITITVAYLPHL